MIMEAHAVIKHAPMQGGHMCGAACACTLLPWEREVLASGQGGVSLVKASDRVSPNGVIMVPSEWELDWRRTQRSNGRVSDLSGGHTEGLYANDLETLRSVFGILAR